MALILPQIFGRRFNKNWCNALAELPKKSVFEVAYEVPFGGFGRRS